MQNVVMDNTIEEGCKEFAMILGLDEPVSPEVLMAALADETYAHNLLTCRKQPAFLKHLMAHPPRSRATAPAANSSAEVIETSNLELIGRAGKALLNWGKVGFAVVDDETLKRREDACLSCPNLEEPKKLLQKLVGSTASPDKIGRRMGAKTCRLCGCNTSKKIRLPSESCPDKHPMSEGLTRWGEPFFENPADAALR